MPKTFSCLEEIKYNINHCLELASSFPKMHQITMFQFDIAKITNLNTPKSLAFFNVMPFYFKFVKCRKFVFEICVLET